MGGSWVACHWNIETAQNVDVGSGSTGAGSGVGAGSAADTAARSRSGTGTGTGAGIGIGAGAGADVVVESSFVTEVGDWKAHCNALLLVVVSVLSNLLATVHPLAFRSSLPSD